MCDECTTLLSEGLDLCVRARKMDAMDRREATLATHWMPLPGDDVAPSPASEAGREAVERRIRNDALEEAACIARNGCLVPPDGGSPTEAEAELCESIASMIRLRKLASPPHPANQMDQIAVSPANKELEEALKRWYRAYHHGSMEDETLQSELLAKAYADQLTQPANPDEGMRS